MKSYAIVMGVLVFAGSAHAQNRPSSPDLTCRQAKSLVAARGAIVLGTGGFTYDRFVRDRSFCEVTQSTQSAFVPTRDKPSCFVGYRCFEPGRDDFFKF